MDANLGELGQDAENEVPVLHDPELEYMDDTAKKITSFYLDNYVQLAMSSLSIAVLLGSTRKEFLPLGWDGLIGRFVSGEFQLLGACLISAIMLMGVTLEVYRLVITEVQVAMNFPPGSFMFFSSLMRPTLGSIVCFRSHDNTLYVRRVRSIVPAPNSSGWRLCCRARIERLQTSGDLLDAPPDQPLYSKDGTAEWLDIEAVWGTLILGPIKISSAAIAFLALLFFCPTFAITLLIIQQPLQVCLVGSFCSLALYALEYLLTTTSI